MQRAVENPGKSAHAERPIGTWNGFISLAIGIALMTGGIWQLVHGLIIERPASVAGIIAAVLFFIALEAIGALFLAGLYHGAAERSGDPAAVRQLPRHDAHRAACAAPIRSIPGARSRCGRAISTASGSRSTTSGATRSRSPRSSSGASRTPPRRASTSTITRITSSCRARPRCGISPRPSPTMKAMASRPRGTHPADAARQRRYRDPGAGARAAASVSTRPASSSRRRA